MSERFRVLFCRTIVRVMLAPFFRMIVFLCLGLALPGFRNAQAQDFVSKERFQASVGYLGSDSLEGRSTGTRGAAMARTYITEKLREYGIQPAGEDGTYLQSIPMHGSYPSPKSAFTLHVGDETYRLTLWDDYVLYKTGAGTFIPAAIPLVFVGYGIVAPEYDYNDYANVDVNNAIVVYLEGEPRSIDDEYFKGAYPTVHSYPELKQRIAFSRGARGSIMLPNPREQEPDDTWAGVMQQFAFEHVTLLYGVPDNLSMYVTRAVAEQIFSRSAYSYADVLQMDSTSSIRSFPLLARASFHGQFTQRDFAGYNIVGMLPGSDPALTDSYILLSAHYDHLGIGPVINGDSIYNGVADNAMGVAALLEIARIMGKERSRKRSVIFLFVTGEEKGLLGSLYYCDNPVVPLYRTIANINIDGIAMFDRFKNVIGIGADLSTIKEALTEAATNEGLTVSDIPPQFRTFDAFERSDQLAFASAGIPAILVMDGMESEHLRPDQTLSLFVSWGRNIYHTPFDDLSQPINFDASVQHITLLLKFAETLADTPNPPQWHEGVPYRTTRLQTRAEER